MPAHADEDDDWLLMGWDPPADIRTISEYGPSLPTQDIPYIDIRTFSMRANETTFYFRLELKGEVRNDPDIEYNIGVCIVKESSDGGPFVTIYPKIAVYSDGRSTFNDTEIPFSVQGTNLTLEIPKTLVEREGCLKNGTRIDLGWSVEAIERRSFHDYDSDILDFPVHSSFFTDDTISRNNPPIAVIDMVDPDPGVVGYNITFVGHGEDMDGSVSESCVWFSHDEYYTYLSSNCSFETSKLSGYADVHEIILRVSDDKGVWTEVHFFVEVMESTDDLPSDAGLLAWQVLSVMMSAIAIVVIVALLVHTRKGTDK
ncbi:MAG: hypothetical protein ACE5IO_06415 [Thermoplasmata archaeon]